MESRNIIQKLKIQLTIKAQYVVNYNELHTLKKVYKIYIILTLVVFKKKTFIHIQIFKYGTTEKLSNRYKDRSWKHFSSLRCFKIFLINLLQNKINTVKKIIKYTIGTYRK